MIFFDNRIVCVGSDIENKAEGGVHTTLFQNFLADAADPLVVNGEAVTRSPTGPNLRAAPSCATTCATLTSCRKVG